MKYYTNVFVTVYIPFQQVVITSSYKCQLKVFANKAACFARGNLIKHHTPLCQDHISEREHEGKHDRVLSWIDHERQKQNITKQTDKTTATIIRGE